MKNLKFNQTAKFNWFTISLGIAVIVAFFLFKNWHIDQNFIGIVESKSHILGAQEPGKVHKMLVLVGERVQKGQLLAMLDISDLKAIVNHLNKELTGIKESEGARRDHSSILVQNLRLQLENEASDLMDRLSLIESKTTELAGLNKEIERLKNAEEAGLGFSRGLSDLIVQRDALASYLREQSKDLDTQNQKLEQARKSRDMLNQADESKLATSFFIEQMEHAENLKRLMSETEHRIKQRTIIAPCDGFVTEIQALSGDVVQEFSPVVTIDEIKPQFLTVYIPEKSTVEINKGDIVEITSARDSKFNTSGVVVFVHPGFSVVGERISFRGQVFWARKIRVAIKENHNLIPGELVMARIEPANSQAGFLPDSGLLNNRPDDRELEKSACSDITDIEVADGIFKTNRFEPSGIAWIPQLQKFLVASDDTGLNNKNSEHSSHLFLMNSAGVLDSKTINLSGVKKIKDIEAITKAEDDIYYLVSSQNISKKGKRSLEREMILKVAFNDGAFDVLDKIPLLTLLEKSLSKQALKKLGLINMDEDGRPRLNIEGAAFFDNSLFFGLKEPVAAKGALIWKLDDPEKVFKTKSIEKNQISLYGQVKLESYKNQHPGIADIFMTKNGEMWILSTIANASKGNQMGGLYKVIKTLNGSLQAENLCRFPGLKPEGLSSKSEKQFMIVFDNGRKTPSYCRVDLEGK